MNAAFVVARQEIRCTSRERLAVALLAVFLGMALVSSAIGWASHHTVMSVYDETILLMGRSIPNPFAGVSALDVTSNSVIYIVLIGALLATVVGVRSSVRDRRAGVADLVFARPIGARTYVAGKLLGVQAWIGIVIVAAMAATWVGVWVVNGRPLSFSETLSLLAFHALAWIFLLPFTVMGMVAGAKARNESTALLVPILVWVAIVFVVPQLGTAQNPTAVLNPVPAPVSSQDLFFRVNHVVLRPISITEHFKHAGAVILHLRDAGSSAIAGDLGSLAAVAILSLAALTLVTRTTLRRPLHE
jgi:ABC-2 type transport system permease protein